MNRPKKQPELNVRIFNLLLEYKKTNPDFEYWWDIANTKMQYFIRDYETNTAHPIVKKVIISKIMIYLIEKWERHIRFGKEIDGIIKDIEKAFKDERKKK